MARTVIAGDFGGTNLRAALVSETGEVLVRHEVSTPADTSPDAVLERIGDLLAEVRDRGEEPVGLAPRVRASPVRRVRGK